MIHPDICRCPQCEGLSPGPQYKSVREAFAEFFYMVDEDDDHLHRNDPFPQPELPVIKPLPGGAPSAHDFDDVPF